MTTNNVIDLSGLKKQQYQVGDKVLELDTSDLKMVARFEKMYPTLVQEAQRISQVDAFVKSENPDVDGLVELFDSIDGAMREALDFIFDANVCEVCIDHGSLFDPINGEFRFEHIINALIPLYETSLREETKKIQERVKKHTAKYTKAKK